jgi:phage gpG-like protein
MPNPFEIPLQRITTAIERIKPDLVDAIGVEALKFIDDNFRLQGYQGRTFIPWAIQQKPNKPRPHKVLILTATLRRSFIKTDGPDYTTISTDSVYARAHNEGSRKQGLPQRQFMPITADDSPVLQRACEKAILQKLIPALKT